MTESRMTTKCFDWSVWINAYRYVKYTPTSNHSTREQDVHQMIERQLYNS